MSFSLLAALQATVYVQVSPQRLSLRNVKTGEQIVDVPEMAIGLAPPRVILAVGSQARAAALQGAELVNPFAHPRTLVSDFTVAEQLLKHQLRKLMPRSLLSLAPHLVIHPLGSPEGGFTQVELRAFRELGLGAGAAHVQVWTGRPLSDQEVLARQRPNAEGHWE